MNSSSPQCLSIIARLLFSSFDRSIRKTSPSRKRREIRRLATEGLEQRRLLAGDLDLSFGDNGQVITPLFSDVTSTDQVRAVAASITGRTYALGANELVAYNADGSLDTSFGNQGRAPMRVDGYGILVESDGRIVVVGRLVVGDDGLDFAISRFLEDGAIDVSFGASGVATVGMGSFDEIAMSVAVDVNGKYVLAGNSGTDADPTRKINEVGD